MYQTNSASSNNTLFGDLQMPEIVPPRLPVYGTMAAGHPARIRKGSDGHVRMSGHPLDNYKFEMRHYNISPLADFTEFKAAVTTHTNPAKQFRLAGLVVDAQHRLTKTGKISAYSPSRITAARPSSCSGAKIM